MWDLFHNFVVGGLNLTLLSGDGGEGSMSRMLKRCSLKQCNRNNEKGRVTAQAIISPVYISLSSPQIAVHTEPIFLAQAAAVCLSRAVLVVL